MLFTSKSYLIIRFLTFKTDIIRLEIQKPLITNFLLTALIIALVLLVWRVSFEKLTIYTIKKTILNVSLLFSGIVLLSLVVKLNYFFN